MPTCLPNGEGGEGGYPWGEGGSRVLNQYRCGLVFPLLLSLGKHIRLKGMKVQAVDVGSHLV